MVYFGLLKDVNTSFFLSFVLKLLTNIRTPGTPGLFGVVKNLALTVIITLSMIVRAWELIFSRCMELNMDSATQTESFASQKKDSGIHQIQIHEWKLKSTNTCTHAHLWSKSVELFNILLCFLYNICSPPHLSHVQQNLVFHLTHAESTNTKNEITLHIHNARCLFKLPANGMIDELLK